MGLRTLARRIRGVAIVGFALVLGACGGGGGGSSPAPAPRPTVTLSANAAQITEGESVQLTWTSTNAASCTASGGWTGALATSGTQTVGPLTQTTNFVVTCTGSGGTASDSGLIAVLSLIPQVTLQATPSIVRGDQTSLLTWTSTTMTSCEASDSWSGSRPTSGSQTVGPFTAGTVSQFTLVCEGPRASLGTGAVVVARVGANQPPVADAGPDRSAGSADRVDLSGLLSHDDFTIVSGAWTQVAGPAVALGPGNGPLDARFTAPIVPVDTVLTFALTVTDDEGLAGAPDTVDITVLPPPPQVMISGFISYERIPHAAPGLGLNYANQQFVQVDDVLVEVLNAATQNVVASGTFPGNFQLEVPGNTNLRLRATAVMSRQAPEPLPHWQISVRDLDDSGAPIGAVYSYTGPIFNSGVGGVHTLEIPSGWNAAGQLTGSRDAAPFAILDAIHGTLVRLLALDPMPDLPPLIVDWSPTNRGGDTFFTRSILGAPRIVLAGEADVDTDEYDPSVIRHEFGHFVMFSVSRNDSQGGAHAFDERVDMRIALGEGFATAFGALTAGDSVYRDSFGFGQHSSGFFDINVDSQLVEGWYSETSVQEMLWDLDNLPALWQVLNGPLRDGDALTSAFALFSGVKQLRPDLAPTVQALLSAEGMVAATIDPYGTTETNNAGSANVLPVYRQIALGNTVQVRSTNEFGVGNKLSTHRFLRLNVPSAGNVRFRASAAVGRDVDMLVYRRGVSLGPSPGPANEDFSLVLQPGDYVVDVYDCGNADCNDSVTPGPVDITVSVTTN
jgi:hypothetical protein